MEREREQAVLELLAEATYRQQIAPSAHTPIYGVVTGVLAARSENGRLTVDYPGNTLGHPVPARSVVACTDHDMGCEIVLMFEKGDPTKPIIIGLVQSEATSATVPISAEVDGERISLNAKHEIVLKCGRASITLTRSGKILIRGAYLLSRSSGVNRIKGGSVQIN